MSHHEAEQRVEERIAELAATNERLKWEITECKRAEEALRESEERYRAIAENIQDALTIVEDGKVVYVNERACEIFGYPRNELVKLTGLDIAAPEEKERLQRIREEVERTAIRPNELEFWIARKDGTRRCVHNRYSIIRKGDGLIARLVVTRDITDRKRAEEALRESQARWRSLVENAPDIIFTVDREGRILFINYAPAGLTVEEALGTNALDYVVPEHREKVRQSLQRVFQTGDPDCYEIAARGPHDTISWYETRLGPIRADGQVVGVTLVTRDITDRKRTEEALRESEEKYRHLVERANDGIAIVQDRIIKYVNPHLAQMWGGTAEEVIGTSFTDHIWPDELPKVVDRYERRMAGEDVPPIYELAVKHKEGHTIYVEVNAGMATYQGKPADLVIVRDITERKRGEEEIRRRNQELAAVNAIATTVSSSLDLQEILDRSLDKVLEVAGVEVGSIYLLDQQAEELVLATYRGVPKEFADQVRTFKMGESLSGRVAHSGEPIVVDDLTRDPQVTTTLGSRQGIRSFAAIPMKSREKVQGVMHVASHKRHPFSPEEVQLYTAIANQIGVAIENAQLWDATKRRLQESAILLEVSRALASVLELEELLQMIIDSAVETIERAESGVIHLLDDATGELHPKALAGNPPHVTGKAGMRIGKGIAGYALERGEVVNVPDVDSAPRFIALEGNQELKSLLVAPLLVEGRRIGTISIKSDQIGAFTPEDERLLMTLAAHAATAVKNAQLFARLEELAILEERNRIASEIHDGLAGDLASLLMRINLCLDLIGRDPQAVKAKLAEVKALVREDIRHVRGSILTLRPPELEEAGFLRALRKYAQGFEEQSELPVHLSIVGEEVQSGLPPTHEHTLFRVLQEALRNVMKHAKAKNVWIDLDLSTPELVSLAVRDDGLGFGRKVDQIASPVWVGGFGLASMKERTRTLGGELIVEAEPGSGTKIAVILPLGKRR